MKFIISLGAVIVLLAQGASSDTFIGIFIILFVIFAIYNWIKRERPQEITILIQQEHAFPDTQTENAKSITSKLPPSPNEGPIFRVIDGDKTD